MQRPANGVEDIAAGRDALAALCRAVTQEGIVIDTKQAAIKDRAARAAKRQQQIDERHQVMQQLSTRFTAALAKSAVARPSQRSMGSELASWRSDITIRKSHHNHVHHNRGQGRSRWCSYTSELA